MTPSEPSSPPKPPPRPTSSTSSWTTPGNTDVILYEYLWRAERSRGLAVGRKVRPCLVVATYTSQGRLRVITAPITTRDYAQESTVDIPAVVAKHLGLDDRARIVWTDLNEFTWVGPDVRTGKDGTPFIARVPERIWRMVLDKIVAARTKPVMRSE